MEISRPHIIVIDNDSYAVRYWTDALREAEYRVSIIDSADLVMQSVDANAVLILMDIKMPPGETVGEAESHSGWLTGLVLANRIRNRFPHLTIIGFSNENTLALISQLSPSPFIAYWDRSTKPSDLVVKVKEFLSSRNGDNTAIMNLNATLDVFISHSHSDSDIAGALIDLLRSACSIPPDRIRCTSVIGYTLPAGVPIDEHLRTEVYDARIFIGLLTPTSIQSTYVLFELGARWGAKRTFVPIVARGQLPSSLPAPLSGINVMDCKNDGQMYSMVTQIASAIGVTPVTHLHYKPQIDRLVGVS